MDFTNDYIMRQLEIAVRGISALMFGREVVAAEERDVEGESPGSGMLYHQLKKMVAEGRIGEAEDALFEYASGDAAGIHLYTALQFYSDLYELDEEELERGGFSHREILDGLGDISTIYGIDLSFTEYPDVE